MAISGESVFPGGRYLPGGGGLPLLWTEWLTGRCRNITFPQFRLQAVKIGLVKVKRNINKLAILRHHKNRKSCHLWRHLLYWRHCSNQQRTFFQPDCTMIQNSRHSVVTLPSGANRYNKLKSPWLLWYIQSDWHIILLIRMQIDDTIWASGTS